jgi:hypothetical protein
MSPAMRKPGTSDQEPLDIPDQQDRAQPAAQSIQALKDFGLLLSVEDAARLLGIGRRLMFELIGSGAVTSVRHRATASCARDCAGPLRPITGRVSPASIGLYVSNDTRSTSRPSTQR